MQLDDYTLEVLKNFSDIQPNLMVEPGKIIKTMAESKNIVAQAGIKQEFPGELRIYDLKEFLSVLSLSKSPDISFHDNHVIVSDKSNKNASSKYFFTPKDSLTMATKGVKMPSAEVLFDLNEETLASLRSASSILGHENLTIRKSGKGISLTVESLSEEKEADTSNKHSIVVSGTAEDDDFTLILKVDNIKIIPGNYNVSVSSKGISQFRNKEHDLVYWIALDKSSTYVYK